MIAIVALTGAIAGFAALYVVLRFALELRRDAARLACTLPSARMLRCRRSTSRISPAARSNGLRLPL